MVRTGWAIAIAMSLAACATTSATSWAPRTDANLATDHGACEAEARGVDINSADSYSGRHSGGGADRVFDLIVEACMTRKGWVKAQ